MKRDREAVGMVVERVEAVLRLHRGGFSTGPYQADDGWRCACGVVVLTNGLAPHALDAWDSHIAAALAESEWS